MSGAVRADQPWIPNPIGPLITAHNAIDFASDPLGYLATKAQEGAEALLSAVLPAMRDITHPNLTIQGFYDSYRLSFAVAIFLAIFFLLRTFMDLAANRVSGTAVVETLTFYFPGFFVAVMFGPAAANGLLAASGKLTDFLVKWAVGGTVTQVTARVHDAINKHSVGDFIGGSFVAMLVYLGLLLACILIMLTLITVAVTQYLTGVAFPLGAAWFVHPAKRHLAWRLVYVWVGTAATPPLLFLMLGAGFRLVDSLTRQFPSDKLSTLVQLLVVIIVLVMVSTTPVMLMRFAPVLPGLASSGASVGPGSGSSEQGGDSGDSQTGQLSREGAGRPSGEGSGDSTPSLSDKVRAQDGAGGGGKANPSSGAGLSRVAAPSEGGGAGLAGAETAGAGAAGGAGAGAAGAGGASAGVTGGVVAAEAAGGAVTATGVGAPVGLAIMAGAAVVGGVAAAVETAVEQGQVGADMAADHTDTDSTFEDHGR